MTNYAQPEDTSPTEPVLPLAELSPEFKAAVFISVIKPYSLRDEQEIIEDVKSQISLVLAGDLARPQAMLAGHTESLDAMFYNLLSQAQREKDPETVIALMSAAIKAHEGCRSAIEGIATFKRLTTTSL